MTKKRSGYRRLTPRQQEFAAECLRNGDNASAAYRHAYPGSQKWTDNAVWCAASKLRNSTKVLQWIEQAQAKARKRTETTVEDYLTDLETLKSRCEDTGNLGAAVKATELVGKVLGFYVDRIKTENDDPAELLKALRPAIGEPMYKQMAQLLGIQERDQEAA